jgi:hypothetical protein
MLPIFCEALRDVNYILTKTEDDVRHGKGWEALLAG